MAGVSVLCCSLEMNVESSRSHLIIGIMVESRNLTNGTVCYGKLSLVDLAGSERAAKTGAKDSQLKVFLFTLTRPPKGLRQFQS